ncbi:MAG: hypothetical protein WAX80_02645 [Minisyncoccia bacterium]
MKNINWILIVGFLIFPLNLNAQEVELEPIIIVPGIMGSWNWEVMLQRSDAGNWDFFPIDHSWDNMINALEDAGYERGVNLFISFYDWRQSNINSATDFLIPTIDQAIANSPTGKVDIIAHSMGGLVVRRYIQSDDYRDDVDQLIMLGTPNYGSSDVYALWEGGEVPINWDNITESLTRFYLWYMTTATSQTADNYDTVHTFIPSVREMLPVYDFLTDLDGSKSYSSLIEAQNPFLDNLNLPENMQNLLGLGYITVIAGEGESTVGSIPVVAQTSSDPKLWKDGIPSPFPPERNVVDGDNRVLLSSAFLNESDLLPSQQAHNLLEKFFAFFSPKVHAAYEGGNTDTFLKQKEINSKHGDLPTTAIPEVFTALSLGSPVGDFPIPPEPDNITSFWFASPVAVKITDPQGRVLTRDSNTIPGAVYTGETDPNGVKMVIIPDGLIGQYKIELIGTANGEYHMAVASFADEGDNIVTAEKGVKEGEKISYTADVNQIGANINLSAPVITEPPTSDTAIDSLNKLIVDVKKYYDEGKIKDKSLYQSLQGDLKIVLAALKEAEVTRPIGQKLPKLHELKVSLAKKLAVATLRSFISKVESPTNKRKLDSSAAIDMSSKAKVIITKINN